MFWERFENLCNEKGIKPNPVAAKIGIKSGTVTKWKNGTIPTGETLIKIANFFNVSIDYLLGRTDIPSIPSGNTVYIPVAARGGGVSYLTFTLDEYMEKIKTSKGLSAPPENAIPLDE